MKTLYAASTVALIACAAWLAAGLAPARPWLALVAPAVAALVFLVGIVGRVAVWLRSAVPFRITTTCGQQRSLPWIQSARLESPSSGLGVVGRMALEVLLFRSLFRNTAVALRGGKQLVYREEKFLWLGAIAFHYSLLAILVRHLRFFVEPTPRLVNVVAAVDGFFQVGAPVVYATDVAVVAALCYLAARRLLDPSIRYLSQYSDHLALYLLLGVTGTGVWMRYIARTDVVSAKALALSLVTFSPAVPAGASTLFLVHLALVSALLVYIPFSKLSHMAGVFFSPTRNLPNDNRRRRHVNPWDYPVKVHTYEEWESEFHDKIKAAGLPLEGA